MISRFFRSFFWSVLLGSIIAWLFFGYVRASSREAVLIEDRYHGLDNSVIRPGEARFIPQRIAPGRVILHRVDLGPRILQLKYKRGLSQSETLGLDDAFYIQADLRIEYSIDADRVDELFLKLDEPDFSRLNEYLRVRLGYFLDRKLADLFPNDNQLPQLGDRLYGYVAAAAVAEMNRELGPEGVTIRSVLPTRIYAPDADRYRAMLTQAPQILERKLERISIVDEARARSRAEEIQDAAYFERLERIGQILRKYPNLQGYLAVDRLSDNVELMVVPYDVWTGASGVDPGALAGERARRPPRDRQPDRGAAGAGEGGNGRFQDLTPP